MKGSEFVLIKIATKEKEKDVAKYKKDHQFSSPILLEDDSSVSNAYGVSSRPQTFFINREGKIVGRALKEMDWSSKNMRELIDYLVKEKK
jgi:peroxiredoxin